MTKRIVVTGASSGIGRASAIALAKSGHELVLIGRREEALKEAAAECGGEYALYDLSDLSGIPALIAQVKKPGVYPVLINSAGIGAFSEFAKLDWSDVEAQVQVNLLAPARLIHTMLPWMLEEGGGQIVNVLSVAASQILPGCGAYGASKAGLLALGKTLSAEYRRQRIKVTSLLPGAVDTPIWDGVSGGPNRTEMIPTEVVAQAIADLVNKPHTFNVDELLLMPTKGIL